MDHINSDNMEDNAAIEMKLWNYIDGTLPPNEISVVEKLVAENQQWKKQYEQLLELQQLLQETELEEPSLRFTANVMDDIAKLHISPATKNYLNKNIIRGIAAFFIAILGGILFFTFFLAFKSNSGNGSSSNNIIDNINWNQFLSSGWINGFLIINIVLAIFLLDRFLASKRKQFQHK